MAIRQYVGARYVPRFMGEFDPTQQYEALDVVDNGSGTAYIARKIVPPGSSLIDPEFWFVYGASSGAIIQIQNDLQAVENDISNNIKPDIQANASAISSTQNDLAQLESAIYGQSRTIITITDSYGYHPSAAQSWQSVLTSMKTDSTFYNFYEGSMGIYHRGSGNHNAETLLTSHSGDIPDPTKITDIVFGLGINDYADTVTDVSNAYDSLINYVRSTYPNARIWFGFVSYTHSLGYGNSANFKTLVNLMIAKCAEKDCKYISNVEYIMHDLRNNEADLVHPNANGSLNIAKAIKMTLEGGIYHYRASTVSNVTANGTVYSNTMIQTIDDGITTIICGTVFNNGNLNFSGADFLQHSTISNPLVKNNTATIFGSIFSSDSNAPIGMRITTDGNRLLISWPKSGAHSIAGCQINDICITADTLDM